MRRYSAFWKLADGSECFGLGVLGESGTSKDDGEGEI